MASGAALAATEPLTEKTGMLQGLLSLTSIERAAYVVFALLIGYAMVKIALALSKRFASKRLTRRGVDIVEKVVKYGGTALVLINAGEIAGIDLTAALGAAGVVGIALGFAAQTSISNIISGLFLFSEKCFEDGDVVQIDGVTGVVESVDMLSVKIRTFDNRLVRVPNETMIKTNIVNVTHWPERRMDIKLTLPYAMDLTALERSLKECAVTVPKALADPEPFFVIEEFGLNGASVLFGVWFERDDFAEVKNGLMRAIAQRLEAEGVRPSAQTLVLASEDESRFPLKSRMKRSDGARAKVARAKAARAKAARAISRALSRAALESKAKSPRAGDLAGPRGADEDRGRY